MIEIEERNQFEAVLEQLAFYANQDLGITHSLLFTPKDDTVLLSYGFKFNMSGDTMSKVHNGALWTVDLSKPVAIWYKDFKKLGGMQYDEVVNLFSVPHKPGSFSA